MSLKEKYLKDATKITAEVQFAGARQIGWRSPSNIALVKYWGKRPDQIPENASLSFTLKNSYTETVIRYSHQDKFRLDFLFEGSVNLKFEKRVKDYLLSVVPYLPFLNHMHIQVSSNNSFPHSSGIASSASSMSALALCLVQIENELFQTLTTPFDFYRKASFLARLGSGSAARSTYGEFVSWGNTDSISDSSDEVGNPYEVQSQNTFWGLKDAILITSKESKKVSSSHGHIMMKNHPWAEARYQQAEININGLMQAIQAENDEKFICIIENEALSLHALMLSSDPGYTLLNQNTWHIIHSIREFRKNSGLFLTFTLDAGPNVHLIYKKQNSEQIENFIRKDLVHYCENGYWIGDEMGTGPEQIKLNG